MIKQETFTKEHINRIVRDYKVDYEIAARSIFALGLVEALVKVGTDFIFKGGSSLMLMFDKVKRFSTDVDIVVNENYEIDKYLMEASKIYPFKSINESIRSTDKRIRKRHFRISYQSTNRDKEYVVLVDVLFEKQNYAKTLEVPIKNELLLCEGKDLLVKVPSHESILGDKLTAFAPHTIGINFFNGIHNDDKRLEVIKQFYDISCLFETANNFSDVRSTYQRVANSEIMYRGYQRDAVDCLMDTFNSALCIASRGKFFPLDYKNYIEGFKRISSYIIGAKLNANSGVENASKIMFLCVCLYKNVDPFSFEIENQNLLEESPQNKINFLKKEKTEAFNYAATAFRLLQKDII